MYTLPKKVFSSPTGCVLVFKSDADAEAYRKEVILVLGCDTDKVQVTRNVVRHRI